MRSRHLPRPRRLTVLTDYSYSSKTGGRARAPPVAIGGSLSRLILRRLATIVPVLLLVSLVDFLLLALVPGDPAVTLAGGANATPQAIAHVRAQLKLDDPLMTQYFRWLGDALQGNLGDSLVTGQS